MFDLNVGRISICSIGSVGDPGLDTVVMVHPRQNNGMAKAKKNKCCVGTAKVFASNNE
jgi:hypothetical protein